VTLEPVFAGRDREELLRQIASEEPRPPRRLNKSIPPELETLLLKAIEKDPSERYDTAQELADDLKRFLKDEPIRARRPTFMQRVRKWARRHRPVVVTAGVSFAVFLMLAVAGLTGAFVVVNAERQRAETARQAAEIAEANERTQRQRADAERDRAEQEKQIAQAVRDFLQKKLLGQADPRQQADALLRAGRAAGETKANPSIAELLDRAAAELDRDKIETQFPNQPLVQAEILRTIGDSYRGIGAYGPAIDHLRRALKLREQLSGPDHPDTLATLNNLALAYLADGKLPEATRLFEQVRDKNVAKLGPDHPLTLNAMNNLAGAYQESGRLPEATRLYEQVGDKMIAKLGPDHPSALTTLHRLALAYRAAGTQIRPSRSCASAWLCAKRTSWMTGQSLAPSHCWAAPCWPRKNTLKPSPCWCKTTRA
jgi:tetratricopeptide (TPR) repeat protein